MSPKRITPAFLQSHFLSASFISGSHLHANVRLYKYYWWIYAENSIYENAQKVFFIEEHKLSTKQAFDMMDKLKDERIKYAYVNLREHRLGTTLWDYKKLQTKFPNIAFAPAYEDDLDDISQNGHK